MLRTAPPPPSRLNPCHVGDSRVVLLRPKVKAARSPLWDKLTKRQAQIVHLLAHGFANKQIAARLDISDSSIQKDRKDILERLGCDSMFHVIAVLAGAVPPKGGEA